jgi:hypothetical protein
MIAFIVADYIAHSSMYRQEIQGSHAATTLWDTAVHWKMNCLGTSKVKGLGAIRKIRTKPVYCLVTDEKGLESTDRSTA